MNRRSKKCKKLLSNKIKTNTREYRKKSILRNGKKFKSKTQVIAVSYSQLRKTNPSCFR